MKLLHSTTKEIITLEDMPFAQGGEGALYNVLSPKHFQHTVAKIYHPNKRNKERQDKLRYLIEHPPVFENKEQAALLSWPLAILKKQQDFVGFLMPKAIGEPLEILATAKLPKRLATHWQRFDFGKKEALLLRQKVCFNIAVALYHIHQTGHYVVVDLKPDNILIQHNGLISLVDMDSIEVMQQNKVLFPAAVATPEFAPPEFHSLQRNTEAIPANWDSFSMTIIFYKILLGIHPFAATAQGKYEQITGLGEKIQHGLYVQNKNMRPFLGVIPPLHQAFNRLPAAIQHLFHLCFSDGIFQKTTRPSAEDWCLALDNKKYQNTKGHYLIPTEYVTLKTDHLLPTKDGIFDQNFEQVIGIVLKNNLSDITAKLEKENKAKNKIYLPIIALPLGGLGLWNVLYINLLLGVGMTFFSIAVLVWYLYNLKKKNPSVGHNFKNLSPALPIHLQPLLVPKLEELFSLFQEQKKEYQLNLDHYLGKMDSTNSEWSKNIFDYERKCRLLNSERKEKVYQIKQQLVTHPLWSKLPGKDRKEKQEHLEQKYLPQQLKNLATGLEQEIKKIDEIYQTAWQKLEKAHYAHLEAISKSVSKQKLAEKAEEEAVFVKKRQEIIDAIQTQKKAAELKFKTQQNLAKTTVSNYSNQLEDIEHEYINKKMAIESSYDLKFEKMLNELQLQQKEKNFRMKEYKKDFHSHTNQTTEVFKLSCKKLLSSKK